MNITRKFTAEEATSFLAQARSKAAAEGKCYGAAVLSLLSNRLIESVPEIKESNSMDDVEHWFNLNWVEIPSDQHL